MKIEKAECSYQVTECDLKFGEQIVLGGELLIPVSVLDKIRADIIELRSRQNVGVLECLEIIDKYRAESEE